MNALHLSFQFEHFAPRCFSVILKRLKEKQQFVATALKEALDAVYRCLSIDIVKEDILEALKDQTPTLLVRSADFL